MNIVFQTSLKCRNDSHSIQAEYHTMEDKIKGIIL